MADNKDKKVLNAPALRFPEFSGEWDEYAIGEILSIGNGRDYKHLHNGDIPVFGTGGYMTSVDDFLYDGESVFVGRKGTINKPLYYNGKFWTVDTLFYTYNFTDVLPKFVYCLFQTINWLKYNEASGVPSLSKATIEKIKVRIPSMDEQDKLSNLLFLLDKRIEVQNKIIEKLETLIKGIIETVISLQKPNTFIKDCLECNSSILQESQVAEYGASPVYGATGITGYTEAADVNGESILIIKDGSGVGTVKYVTGEYSYIGTLNRLIAKDGYYLKYIYFALQGFSFEPYKTGMAIPHIYFKDYGKAKIFCPTIEKQSAIAQKLSSTEDKVSVEKQILFYYQVQKSYLLSQMLI
ncbi:restriction endonuclease subunit S [Bacteroides thetaiotaomicron]|uniref:restriction endonuclease subunit S n=1 Tax=Bacteroides thetaiotaomicron TaxID=818 RepID=UPI0039B6A558